MLSLQLNMTLFVNILKIFNLFISSLLFPLRSLLFTL